MKAMQQTDEPTDQRQGDSATASPVLRLSNINPSTQLTPTPTSTSPHPRLTKRSIVDTNLRVDTPIDTPFDVPSEQPSPSKQPCPFSTVKDPKLVQDEQVPSTSGIVKRRSTRLTKTIKPEKSERFKITPLSTPNPLSTVLEQSDESIEPDSASVASSVVTSDYDLEGPDEDYGAPKMRLAKQPDWAIKEQRVTQKKIYPGCDHRLAKWDTHTMCWQCREFLGLPTCDYYLRCGQCKDMSRAAFRHQYDAKLRSKVAKVERLLALERKYDQTVSEMFTPDAQCTQLEVVRRPYAFKDIMYSLLHNYFPGVRVYAHSTIDGGLFPFSIDEVIPTPLSLRSQRKSKTATAFQKREEARSQTHDALVTRQYIQLLESKQQFATMPQVDTAGEPILRATRETPRSDSPAPPISRFRQATLATSIDSDCSMPVLTPEVSIDGDRASGDTPVDLSTPTPECDTMSITLNPNETDFLLKLQQLANNLLNEQNILKVTLRKTTAPGAASPDKIKLVARTSSELQYTPTTNPTETLSQNLEAIELIRQTHEVVNRIEQKLPVGNPNKVIGTVTTTTPAISPPIPLTSSTPFEMSLQGAIDYSIPEPEPYREKEDIDDVDIQRFTRRDFPYENSVTQIATIGTAYKIDVIWADPNWLPNPTGQSSPSQYFHGPEILPRYRELIRQRCLLAKEHCQRKSPLPSTTPVSQFQVSWAPYLPACDVIPINPLRWPKRNFSWMPPHQTPETKVIMTDREARIVEGLSRQIFRMRSYQEMLANTIKLFADPRSGQPLAYQIDPYLISLIDSQSEMSKVTIDLLYTIIAIRRNSFLSRSPLVDECLNTLKCSDFSTSMHLFDDQATTAADEYMKNLIREQND